MTTYSVGGVRMQRPFKVLRQSHWGLNVTDVARCLPFYRDLLGFMVADELELKGRFKDPKEAERFAVTKGYFMRHGTEHHSMALFPKHVLNALKGYPPLQPSYEINQIAWQVGSPREVLGGISWLRQHTDLLRIGRDLPGGNWHAYGFDPEGHVNEIFYGLEQVGWDRRSKSLQVNDYLFVEPTLPVPPEYEELARAQRRGLKDLSGYRFEELGEPKYDVDGVLLPRPFKVTRTGPVRLFVADVEQVSAFYRHVLGLKVTEEVVWQGHRCVFLRANTEHHSLALYPMALREALGLRDSSTCFSVGVQVANYNQLRAAVQYLREHGCEIRMLPQELHPGIDYSAFVLDPEGQAVQLYYGMEQVGWDGRPRPAAQRLKVDAANWPETLPEQSDSYGGEVFLGPWS